MAGFHRKRRRGRRAEPRDDASRQAGRRAKRQEPADESVPTPADVARRVRDEPGGAASTSPVLDPEPEPREPAAERDERGLRGLVGSGASQVGVWTAARARDAARPTEDDLARAEAELTIVRRNWVPREPFRPGGRH